MVFLETEVEPVALHQYVDRLGEAAAGEGGDDVTVDDGVIGGVGGEDEGHRLDLPGGKGDGGPGTESAGAGALVGNLRDGRDVLERLIGEHHVGQRCGADVAQGDLVSGRGSARDRVGVGRYRQLKDADAERPAARAAAKGQPAAESRQAASTASLSATAIGRGFATTSAARTAVTAGDGVHAPVLRGGLWWAPREHEHDADRGECFVSRNLAHTRRDALHGPPFENAGSCAAKRNGP